MVVEPTHSKNIKVKMGSSSPIFGVKIKHFSCHHLVILFAQNLRRPSIPQRLEARVLHACVLRRKLSLAEHTIETKLGPWDSIFFRVGHTQTQQVYLTHYCWWFRNPANQLIWQNFYVNFKDFIHPKWCRISTVWLFPDSLGFRSNAMVDSLPDPSGLIGRSTYGGHGGSHFP